MTVKSKVFLLPIPYINFTDKWNSIEKSIFYDDLTLINMFFLMNDICKHSSYMQTYHHDWLPKQFLQQ